MKKLLLILALISCALMAADATGKWSGTLTKSDGESMPALVVLKQEGAKLTGSAGPDEGERHEIIEGKVEGSRLTFQVQSPGMKFDLSQEGDEITGEVTRERNGETQKAKLTLKREK